MTATAIMVILALQGDASGPEAKALFERARREHQLGNYEAAGASFSELYRKTGESTVLFNAAQSLRLAGKNAEALAAYRGYLRERPDAENRAMVEAKIRELEAALRQGASPPRPTQADVAAADLVDPVPLRPPSAPRARVGRPETPKDALPTAKPAAEDRSAPAWRWRWWAWAAVGAVVLGSTIAVVAASRGTDVPGTPLGNQGIFR